MTEGEDMKSMGIKKRGHAEEEKRYEYE